MKCILIPETFQHVTIFNKAINGSVEPMDTPKSKHVVNSFGVSLYKIALVKLFLAENDLKIK